MNLLSLILVFTLLVLSSQEELDMGSIRLNALRNRSLTSPDRIIDFSIQDVREYILQYPRPYTIVIYFSAKQMPLSQQLYPEYNYTVQLYSLQGAIDAEYNPTFFARIEFDKQTENIFRFFGFNSAPNLLVSKPHMAVISQAQRQSYFKDYKWRISHTDGVVTTQKMLDFINKRTQKNIVYKPSEETIRYVLSIFVGVSVVGVIVYKLLRVIWSHWLFWFIASLVLLGIFCMSGIVHCILDDSIAQDLKQRGRITFFTGRGGRDQGFYQGCLISGCVTLAGVILVAIGIMSEKLRERYSGVFGVVGLIVVYYLIVYIEGVYGVKSWYGPSYRPPQGYISGPLNLDQGNNI